MCFQDVSALREEKLKLNKVVTVRLCLCAGSVGWDICPSMCNDVKVHRGDFPHLHWMYLHCRCLADLQGKKVTFPRVTYPPALNLNLHFVSKDTFEDFFFFFFLQQIPQKELYTVVHYWDCVPKAWYIVCLCAIECKLCLKTIKNTSVSHTIALGDTLLQYSDYTDYRGCHTLLKPYETNCDLWIWAIQIKFDWLIE